MRRGKGKNVKKESRSLSDFSGTDFGVSRGQCTLEDLENIYTVKCFIDPAREIPTFTLFKTRASSLYRVAKKKSLVMAKLAVTGIGGPLRVL